jgi:hypothetical protein
MVALIHLKVQTPSSKRHLVHQLHYRQEIQIQKYCKMAKPMQMESLNLSWTRLHHVITQVIKYKKV